MPHLPSRRVIEAIHKASEKLTVCVATGRPFHKLSDIFTLLKMNGYAITNDGALVVEIPTKKVVYQQTISEADFTEVRNVATTFSVPFYVTDNDHDILYTDSYIPHVLMNMYADEVFTEKQVDTFVRKLSHIPTLTIHKTQHGKGRKFGFLISHEKATKQHGVLTVAQQLGVNTHEIIGVGDGYNDFPLLMACGLKVAMDNGVDDLKAIADFIAPPVEKDGVVEVVERFVLNNF
jgi:Cof subfamily protein (haloacid dehalogenase superfamily)